MSTAALSPASPRPSLRAVVAEQLRAVGLGIRLELLLLSVFMAGLAVFVAFASARYGEPVNTDIPNLAAVIFLLSLAAPLGVWKGEEPSRRGYLWALPLPRRQGVLAKVFAGWAWLMAVVALVLLWAVVMAGITGGEPGLDRALSMLDGTPRGTRMVSPSLGGHTWLWLLPFTGATVAYLLGSILALASDHPWRWVAGGVFAFLMLGALSEITEVEDTLTRFLSLSATAILGTSYREVTFIDPAGVTRTGMRNAPDFTRWIVQTVAWTAIGLAGVYAAAHRRKDR